MERHACAGRPFGCAQRRLPCCWWKRYSEQALLPRVAAHKPRSLPQLLPHLQQPPHLAALGCVVEHVAAAPVALRNAGTWGPTRGAATSAQKQRRPTLHALRPIPHSTT